MLDRIEFLVTEAFVALRRNTWMTFAAITTATVALFLLGSLTYIFLKVNVAATNLGEKVAMRVFLKEDVNPEDLEQTKRVLLKMPEIREVVFVPRDQAWKEFRRDFPDVVEGMENPLPDAFRIIPIDIGQAQDLKAKIERLPSVEPGGVRYQDDARQVLTDGLRLLRQLGMALGAVMLLTSGILIYNTIRMTIQARAREIKIMRLVGATKAMVMAPMLIEGIVQGAIGGACAGMLMWGSFVGIQNFLASMSSKMPMSPFPVGLWCAGLAILGASYGAVCSLFALREPRRTR
jgi:cell division transport system permease protein